MKSEGENSKEIWNKVREEFLKMMRDQDLTLKETRYFKPCPYDMIDVYRVLSIYNVTDPCIQHAVKKLLCAGQRGYKEVEKDIQEAQQSLARYFEMRKEEDGNSD